MFDEFLVSLLAGVPAAVLSVKRGVLTLPAAVAAHLLLIVICTAGGYGAALYMLAVYAPVVAVHILRRRRGNRQGDGRRGLYQVLCNGLAGGVCLLLFRIFSEPAFYLAYFAAMAEFLADTLASDVGTLFPVDPYDICRLRRVPRGQSGGVSLFGTAAALLGCLYAFLLAWATGIAPAPAALCAGLGFLGMLADSVLGSLVQGKYRCAGCGVTTERRRHCDRAATLISGFSAIGNSEVNLIANLLTATSAVLLSL